MIGRDSSLYVREPSPILNWTDPTYYGKALRAEGGAHMPDRSVCLVTLSLSEDRPGRLAASHPPQTSIIPYHTVVPYRSTIP